MFHRPKIPRPICAKCKRDLRDYGGYKQYVANGINLSDVWDDVSPVRHMAKKARAANELPLVIPNRIVSVSGRKGGLIVDPFVGGGSTVIAAFAAEMRFIVCNRESVYCRVVHKRLNDRETEGTTV